MYQLARLLIVLVVVLSARVSECVLRRVSIVSI